jgi:hypothetical protein
LGDFLLRGPSLDDRFDNADDRFDNADDRFDNADDRFDKSDDSFRKAGDRFENLGDRLGWAMASRRHMCRPFCVNTFKFWASRL